MQNTGARSSFNAGAAAGSGVLLLLLAANLLNYIDRQALYAVFPLIQADFHLTDSALGLLGSSFMISYTLSAPLLGWLGDRMHRPRLAARGLVAWSAATVGAGLAPNYSLLFAARALVGVGEATFGSVSPGLVADGQPHALRGRVLSYFYLAIPVGSALGYLLGGVLGNSFGWHAAFLIVGAPGLVLAFWIAKLPDPAQSAGRHAAPASFKTQYHSLFANRSFALNTLAMAAMTFALGGLAQWMPTYLYREFGLDVAKANTLFGGMTVVSGIAGTLVGGWIGDSLQKKYKSGYLLVSGWGFVLSIPIAFAAFMATSLVACCIALFIAEFLLFLNTGPLNTVIVNVTRPGMRSTAFAVNIFFIHILGDAISPAIIGWLSDNRGLRFALMTAPGAILIAAIFCFACARFIARDMHAAESAT
jgi:predicted MFS family arabinose efflux permease